MKGKPQVSSTDVDRVKSALAHGRWMKGRDITKLHGIPFRLIRAVAQQTGQIISSQQGYKLAAHASIEELEHARADLVSRSRHIDARAAMLSQQIAERQHQAQTGDLFRNTHSRVDHFR